MPTPDAEAAAILANAATAQEVTPGHLLRQAKRLLDQAEKLVEQAVVAERSKGTSWDVIGDVLGGVTKSAAQKRYGARVERWKAQLPALEIVLGRPAKELRSQDIEVGVAYASLKVGWKTAGEIVGTQGLLNDLNNATTALSGSWSSTTGVQEHFTDSVVRDCHLYPPSGATTSPEDLAYLGRALYRSELARHPEALSRLLLTVAERVTESEPAANPRLSAVQRRLRALQERQSDGTLPTNIVPRQTNVSLEDRVAALEEHVALLLEEKGDRRRSPPQP